MSLSAADTLVSDGNALFQQGQFAEASVCFERASSVFPSHHQAWKGLGHSMLCMHRPTEAARAFDRAIGLRPESATALWGGALAHADLGHRMIAQNYLRRALALQPTWIEMARSVPQLSPFLQLSAHAGDLLRRALGPYSARTFKHATDASRGVDVVRVGNTPVYGAVSYASLGLCDHVWPEEGRPRVEIVLAALVDHPACPQIVANAAFHLMDKVFFPEPGTMIRDIIAVLEAGELSQRLPHVFFSVPHPWNLHLPLDVGPPPITLAMAVPVSEAEYQFWRSQGDRAFLRLLEDSSIDVTDLRRPSMC